MPECLRVFFGKRMRHRGAEGERKSRGQRAEGMEFVSDRHGQRQRLGSYEQSFELRILRARSQEIQRISRALRLRGIREARVTGIALNLELSAC